MLFFEGILDIFQLSNMETTLRFVTIFIINYLIKNDSSKHIFFPRVYLKINFM